MKSINSLFIFVVVFQLILIKVRQEDAGSLNFVFRISIQVLILKFRIFFNNYNISRVVAETNDISFSATRLVELIVRWLNTKSEFNCFLI